MLRKGKRVVASLLAAVLLVGQLGATVYAEGPPSGTGGLCEHHAAHDDTCGFVEAVKGHNCKHEHTPECYTDQLICGLDEDAEQTASGSDAGHQHGQECYALDCLHERGEHDDACGYIEAVAGTPCGYVCDVCNKEPDKDSGTTSGNTPAPVEPELGNGEPEDAGTITVTAFDALESGVKVQSLPLGAPESDVTLPATLGASGYAVSDDTEPVPEQITITGVTWEADSPWDETAQQGGYTFTPVFPAGYTLADAVELPEINVLIGAGNMLSAAPQAVYHAGDMAAFQAILTAHPSLVSNGVDKNDPASWATAGLVRWDTSSPKRLDVLFLYDKGLTGTLDVGSLTNLNFLSCESNQLEKLEGLGSLTKLVSLYCGNNQLTGTLDVRNLTNLTELHCESNQLEKLEGLGSLTKNLIALSCHSNQLTGTLDVKNLTNLIYLSCHSNQLTGTLDVGNLTNLVSLYCRSNQLEKLEGLGSLTNLNILSCERNQLEKLEGLGSLTKLAYLYCGNNPYTSFTTKDGHTLTVTPATGGKIWMTAFNMSNNEVELTATPDSGYTFQAWSGLPAGAANTQTTTFSLSENISISAAFDPINLTLAFADGAPPQQGAASREGDYYWQNNDWCLLHPQGERELLLSGGGSIYISWAYPDPSLHIFRGRLTGDVKAGQGFVIGTYWYNSSDPDDNHDAPASLFLNGGGFGLQGSFGTAYLSSVKITGGLTVDGNIFLFSDSVLRAEGSFVQTAGHEVSLYNNALLELRDQPAADWLNRLRYDDLTMNPDGQARAVFSDGEYIVSKDGVVKLEPAATPVATPAGGVYSAAQNVTITCATSGATIYYTLDGSNPVTSGTRQTYSAPFTVPLGTTLKAYATASGYADSAVLTEIYTKKSSSGGSSSSNDGTNRNYIITTPQPPKPNNPVLAVIELPVTVGNGTATGKPDDGRTASAIAEAGNKAGAKQNGIAVQYDAKTSKTYDGFSIVIQRATLKRLIENKVEYVTLNTGIVDLTFDLAALKEIAVNSTGDITLTAKRETVLAGDALAAVGKRPAYRLSVNYTGKDGKAATVQSFGAGRVTVGLAYAPAATEQAGSLCLVYSKDGKSAEWLYSSYDRTSGNVIASVGHFSVYAVGHRPAPAFIDTVNHWAKPDIDFVVSRGLLTGTGETTFSPDSTITRGMFVTALGRLAGVDPAAYPSSSRYTDVAATAYYAPYVEWAASKGIVNGTGDKSFSPDAAITREQMAAIMQWYADKLGYTLPVAREAEIFADEGQITSGMKNAVQVIQQAGIMNGKGGHRFGPKDTATRAEAAAVLRRFAEVVIDRATAGGWGQNDAGKWLYYEDAKPVTGWKQIDSKWYYFDSSGLMQAGGWREIGGKWYYFYPDGAMAVNTKIDGYEIGPDGARKEKQ